MIYQATIITPITIYTISPLRTVLKVSKGLVYKVEVESPVGPQGLLQTRIMDGGHQLWPSSVDEYFHPDGLCISFDDTFLKLAEPFQFDILTWNIDDTYSHEVTVRIGMVSQEIYMARFLPSMAYEQLLILIREEQAKQEAEKEGLIEKPFSWIEEE